ncbi:unnamed protein product [Diamesa serratosioi]
MIFFEADVCTQANDEPSVGYLAKPEGLETFIPENPIVALTFQNYNKLRINACERSSKHYMYHNDEYRINLQKNAIFQKQAY